MATITRFDQFPTELICCVFDFLSPVDRYHSFFHCGARLRALVKQRTEFSRRQLDADIRRFSTLHSWYKHLTLTDGGSLYYLVPIKGEQPRYTFDPRVRDAKGLHWWFVYGRTENLVANEKARAIITRHPIRLNLFFYHQNMGAERTSSDRYFYGGDIILSRWSRELRPWLSVNYPDHVDQIFPSSEHEARAVSSKLTPIFEGEWSKITAAIHEAAVQIWNELRELGDVNPLQIVSDVEHI